MDKNIHLHQALTGLATCIYLALFFYIYLQLILVLVYNYKRWCYRTFVLYLSIIWAALRVTLFSYYWCAENGIIQDDIPELSRHIGKEAYFLLFSLPLCLQFTVLCLLVAYFSEILAISDDPYNPSHFCTFSKIKPVIIIANVLVILVNLICSILIKESEHSILPDEVENVLKSEITDFPILITYVIYFRVIINGSMFILLSIFLAIVVIQVSKTEEVRLLLETENITPRGAVSVGTLLVFLYVVRTIANILALIPSVPWVYDTDQVDLLSDSSHGYYMFLSVLFLWEYLPTFASVYFFRAKKPQLSNPNIGIGVHPSEDEEVLISEDFDSCSLTFDDDFNGPPPLPPLIYLGYSTYTTTFESRTPPFSGRPLDSPSLIYYP